VHDLHRAPQFASPTLLVVGEVVRLSDPAAIAQQFVIPDLPAVDDPRVPVALFNNHPRAGSKPERRSLEHIESI
jgi:hypothetical protein